VGKKELVWGHSLFQPAVNRGIGTGLYMFPAGPFYGGKGGLFLLQGRDLPIFFKGGTQELILGGGLFTSGKRKEKKLDNIRKGGPLLPLFFHGFLLPK